MADGAVLPPMLIFKGKTNRTIRNLAVPSGMLVVTQEKAWMDEKLMLEWLDKIWLPHTESKQKELEFTKSFLTLDAFSAHKVDSVCEKMSDNNVGSQLVPPGCTSKVQVLDVSLNRPFKAVLTESWEDYVLGIVNDMDGVSVHDPNFVLPAPSRQHIVDWVQRGYEYLVGKPDLVRKAFKACGVTSTDPNEVRNDTFLRSIMSKVAEEIKDFDLEELDNDPFAEDDSNILEEL